MADTFDWKALGLSPLYDGGQDASDAHDYSQGTLVGYYSQPDADGMIDQYDTEGKLIQRYQKNETGLMPLLKQVATSMPVKIFLAAAAGGLLSGALGVGGAAADVAGLTALDSAAYTAAGDVFLPGAGSALGTVAEDAAALTQMSNAGTALGTAAEDAAALTNAGAQTATTVTNPGLVNTGAQVANTASTPFMNPDVLSPVTGAAAGMEYGSAASGGVLSWFKNAADAVNTWMTANPLLTNALGFAAKSVMDAYKSNSDNQTRLDIVDKQNQGQIDLERLKEEERRAKQKAYSESVGSLRSPGLINARPLKRLDGSLVYGTNGLINQPVRG